MRQQAIFGLAALISFTPLAPLLAQDALGDLLAAQLDPSDANAEATSLIASVRPLLETVPARNADRAQIEAAAEVYFRARAEGLPDVVIQASANIQSGNYDPGPEGQAFINGALSGFGGSSETLSNFGALGGINQRQAAVTVTQPLFTGLRIKNSIQEARHIIDAGFAQLDAMDQDYIVQLADAHLSAITAGEQIRLVEASLELVTQARRAAQISFEAGQSTRTDIALADSRLAGIQAQLASAQAQALAAQNRYRALTGRAPAQIDMSVSVLPLPATLDDAIEKARTNHPLVLAGQAQVEAREAAVRAAKGRRSPSLQLQGQYAYSENNFFDGDNNDVASLTAQMSVPVFQGGAIGSAIREAKAEARSARFALDDIERNVAANVRNSFANYQAALIQREAAASRLNAANLAFRGMTIEREVGQRSILDVLEVQEDLLAAEVEAIEAEARLVLASFQYRAATGDLLD